MASFVYCTQDKLEQTPLLVLKALEAGLRCIDAGGSTNGDHERLVGEAIRKALEQRIILQREDIKIQAAVPAGQGAEFGTVEERTHATIRLSLQQLRHEDEKADTGYLDTLILQLSSSDSAENLQIWRVMESYVPSRVRTLGISVLSGVSLPAFKRLYNVATVKPAVVQASFSPDSKFPFERSMRQLCAENDVSFQACGAIRSNHFLLQRDVITEVSRSLKLSREMTLCLLVQSLPGNVHIVTGTSNLQHMKACLLARKTFHDWSHLRQMRIWEAWVWGFQKEIGD